MKMPNILITIIFILLFLQDISAQYLNYQYEYNYKDGIPLQNFKERRAKLNSCFSNKSVLIFLSPDFYSNRFIFGAKAIQSQNLYYLSGIPPQKAVLILIPDGYKINDEITNEILFLQQQDENDIKWNGVTLSPKNAVNILNIKTILPMEDFEACLVKIISDKDSVFIDKLSTVKHFSNTENTIECDIKTINIIKNKFPNININENIPYVNEMRKVKDNDEIRIMQKAVDITIEGHKAAMKAAVHGITEYQLQAEMEYEFYKSGAEYPAYISIAGAGKNSCILHYHNNRDTAFSGDLVLMDCGAMYHGYTSDITRTFPVNGSFSAEQKIIYKMVLEASDSAMNICRSGIKFEDIDKKAKEIIAEKLVEQSIIDNANSVGKYFPHGTSHYLGLNVHDVGIHGILEAGQILTIEPGIYIPEGSNCDKRWWNIGIRIEDDILITKNGFINMSVKLPRTVDEIELYMRK